MPATQKCIGNQTGGRVFLFLHTDDFWRDYQHMQSRGVVFVEEPTTPLLPRGLATKSPPDWRALCTIVFPPKHLPHPRREKVQGSHCQEAIHFLRLVGHKVPVVEAGR